MNQRTFILFLICTFSFIFPVKAELSPEIAKIKNRGKLTVGILEQDYPPFFMKDKNGKLIGFDVELAERIGKELSVKVEFDRTSKTFDDVVDLVSQKKIDVAISKLSINLTRAQKVSYTNSYIFIKSAVLMNRLKNFKLEKMNISEILPLMNKPSVSIGIVKGTTHVGSMEQDFPKAKIIEFDSQEASFEDVVSGKIDFVQTHETNIKNWLRLHPEKSVQIKVLLRNDIVSPIAMAVAWDNRDLTRWLNTLIDVISNDGTLDKLKKYYVDSFDWDKNINVY